MKNAPPVTNMRRVLATLPLGIWLGLVVVAASMSQATDATYTEVLYPSGGLRIQAYMYKPDGNGPFPVVVYNHGSRAGASGCHAVPIYRRDADAGRLCGPGA